MHPIIEEDIEAISRELENFREKIAEKKFLITGGAGFLGSWFCDVIIALNGKVICVDNLSSGSTKNINHLLANPNFRFVQADVIDYQPKEAIDYIVHMASIASPSMYMEHPVETLDANIIGIKKILEMAKSLCVKEFLFTSTSEVYGNPSDQFIPTPESYYGFVNSFGPRSMYDEGKRAAEAYCYSYFIQSQKEGKILPIRIARIFNTYGPKLDIEGTSLYGRALIKFIYQALNGKPVTVYGDGKQTRSFCYIADQIVGLFKLLLAPGIDGEVINIGNNTEISILDLAKLIIGISNSKSSMEFNSLPTYSMKDDPRRRCPDIKKAEKLLHYQPKTDLKEGLKRTIEWARENL